MNRTKISAFIVTLNEEKYITKAIDSLAQLDEVIVVDSGSTDQTIEIAESLGAKAIHQEWLGFAKQKAFALAQCRNEWCINLDGDEELPLDTLKEIQNKIDSNSCDMIRIPIEDIFMGQPMHPWSRKRSIVRVFKKSKVIYPTDRLVHENVIENGIINKVKSKLIHYGYDDTYLFSQKYNKYAMLSAKTKYNKGKSFSTIKLLAIYPFTFIKVYIFRKLFFSGLRGFIQSHIEANYAFMKEACLFQYNKKSKSS